MSRKTVKFYKSIKFRLSSIKSKHSTCYKATVTDNRHHNKENHKNTILTFIKVHVRNGFALKSSAGRSLGHHSVLMRGFGEPQGSVMS